MIPAQLAGPDVRHLVSDESGVSIPCITAKGMVFMAFELTPEEKVAAVAGCPVWVAARGPFIPELTLRVGEKGEVIPWDLQRAAVQENVPGGDDAERVVAASKPTKTDYVLGSVLVWGSGLLLACAGAWLVRHFVG